MADTPILVRIAAGDSSAVAECLDRYSGLVWSLARQFLGNQADAEDAVQDVFIAIWSSADRYKPEIASEVTFVSTITRRRLIDRIRKNGRRPVTDSLDADEGAPMEPAVAAGQEESAEMACVERVMDEMPEQHRSILSMSLYEGYSHSEIADQLDVPLGTVKTRVRRGLMRIREQLEIGDEAVDTAT
jgi:RNA polymerase sigma-70 factor (ECF subfamily)